MRVQFVFAGCWCVKLQSWSQWLLPGGKLDSRKFMCCATHENRETVLLSYLVVFQVHSLFPNLCSSRP